MEASRRRGARPSAGLTVGGEVGEPTVLDQDDVEVRGLGEGKGKEETVDRWDNRG